MRILFLARSLETGGAERQLVTLASGLHARGHDVRVAVFYPTGPLRADLVGSGVPVEDLRKRSRWDLAGFLAGAIRAIRRFSPDVLHAYLVAPNLVSALVRECSTRTSVVWGVRASDMDFARYDTLSRVTFALSVSLARRADLLIANSEAGRRFHVAAGYPAERFVVIPNGVDTARFFPDRELGRPLRERWGVRPGQRLVGLVGRADPMKDHATFLAAAELAAEAEPGLRFACIGPDGLSRIAHLRTLPGALRLGDRLFWEGESEEMPAVYNALDVLALSSSFGEGFPNAVAEAMACGVPCAVTDVGDAASIVGGTGVAVPPRDPRALAAAILGLAESDSPPPRREPRERILREFSVEALCERTEAALAALVRRS